MAVIGDDAQFRHWPKRHQGQGMLIDHRFTAVAARFFSMFRLPRHGGGALAVFLDGEPVVDVWAGWADRDSPWRRDTMALSFSTGKGVAATVLHRLAERGEVAYDTPVAEYWPEFAANGKSNITVRHVLNHRAGLQRIRGLLPDSRALLDHAAVAEVLAASAADPLRHCASGYHTVTFGTLVAEIAQRATGRDFREIVRQELVTPLSDLDFWFGVPADQRHRVARLAPRVAIAKIPFDWIVGLGAMMPLLESARSSIYRGVFDVALDPVLPYESMMPSWNGVFTARALAKMYAAIANDGVAGRQRLLRPETTREIAEMRPNGRFDYVLGVAPQFALGYHRAPVSARLSRNALGHYGIGG